MITLKFSDLIWNPKAEAELKKKIQQYISIMTIRNPLNPDFQKDFAEFYQLRGWNSASNRPIFFGYFNDLLVASKGTQITYTNVINKFAPRNEKSFSSKILHTLYPDKPIIDQKVLAKLENDIDFKKAYPAPLLVKRKSGKDKHGNDKYNIIIGRNTVVDSKDFYCNLENYYPQLISYNKQIANSPETYTGNGEFVNKGKGKNATYFENFDNWCKEQKINSGIISDVKDVKKADFWMWLA